MFEVTEVLATKKDIDSLFKRGEIYIDIPETHGYINLVNETTRQSVLGIADFPGNLKWVDTKDLKYQGWSPKDREQSCYFWSLKNRTATFCLGAAGTGKTSIAIAYGINNIFRKDKELILCKPTVFVGQKSNAIAAVPGNERDKLAPYMDSYLPAFKKILGRDYQNFIYEWEEKEMLSFRAIELIRGQHFENCTLIIDEAQNLDFHQIISILSRIGEGSSVIILGDPDQIDTGMKWEETGLSKFTSSLACMCSSLTSVIKLRKQYRGPMAQLCQEVLEESRESDS